MNLAKQAHAIVLARIEELDREIAESKRAATFSLTLDEKLANITRTRKLLEFKAKELQKFS